MFHIESLQKFLADIYHDADNKHFTEVIYFDFKRAFNTALHNKLSYKLWMEGITRPLWHWFKNYLCNHNHYVLLFLVYINNIPRSICKSFVYLSADDTKTYEVLYIYPEKFGFWDIQNNYLKHNFSATV